MRATTRTMLSVGAIVAIATMTIALAGAQPQNTNDPAGQPTARGRGPGFGRFGGPGGPGGPMGLGPIMRLDLSDAQRAQVKGVVDSRRDEMRALAARAGSAHDALQAAVTADALDEGTIRARSADVASVEADMAVAQARLRSEVLQILTADQRTRLKTMETEMQNRRHSPPQQRR